MKEKIIEALKKKFFNFGLSKEALDAVASFYEKSITKEEDIESSIESAEPFLRFYQKETDALRGKTSKAEKDLADYKAAHPETNPTEPTNQTEPTGSKTDPAIAEMQQQIAELQRQNAEANRKVLVSEITKKVGEEMNGKGCVNEAVRNIILGKLVVAEDATIETATTLAESCVNEYNTLYKTLYGESPVPNQGGGYNPEEYKPGMFAGAIKKMENSGILPPEQK